MEASITNAALRNIVLAVIALHGVALAWAAFSIERTVAHKPHRPLVVKTIALQPIENRPAIAQNPPKSPTVKKEIKKKEIKNLPPKPTHKPNTPKKTVPVDKKPLNTKLQGLLAQAQASMAKIETQPEKLSTVALALPQLSTRESSYEEELSSLLRQHLRLPEFGPVQIELTLGRMGNVKKIKVMKSESERNRAYVENALETMNFPPFGKKLSTADYVFHIKLENQ